MLNKLTAIKIEFRIPEFYWGEGLIITDGIEFHGLIGNDLILGTISSDKKMHFSIYFRFPVEDDEKNPEYIDMYEFNYPRQLFLSSTFNVQGQNDKNDIIIGIFTTEDVYTNQKVIDFVESGVERIKQELSI